MTKKLLFLICSALLVATGRAGNQKAVKSIKFEDGRVLSLRYTADPTYFDSKNNPVSGVPPRTMVKILLNPAKGSYINVEVWLPQDEKWNGRFVGLGNGGSGSIINPDGFIGWVKQGYAVATTDMGTAPDSESGVGNMEVWKDFGFRATHLMTVTAKQVVEAFYGKPPIYSYFSGGSTGGQQALQEAQRYPEDYDGIITRVPAHCRTPLHAFFLWNYQITQKCPITPEQNKNIMAAAVEYMAPREIPQLAGKMISDPRCTMADIENVIALAMKKDSTLTPQHAEALRKIFDGPKNSAGERIFNGVPFGSSILSATGHLYLFRWAFGADRDLMSINFDEDIDTYTQLLGPYLNAENPDLGAFEKRGGKMIMLSGAADAIVPYHATLDYYERCIEKAGSLEKLQSFCRFYLVPGAGHGAGLPGVFERLVVWREKGIAPDMIPARLTENTPEPMELPLYPYPAGTRRGGVDRVAERFSPAMKGN